MKRKSENWQFFDLCIYVFWHFVCLLSSCWCYGVGFGGGGAAASENNGDSGGQRIFSAILLTYTYNCCKAINNIVTESVNGVAPENRREGRKQNSSHWAKNQNKTKRKKQENRRTFLKFKMWMQSNNCFFFCKCNYYSQSYYCYYQTKI